MSKLVIGVNDLATVRPDLIKEWHPTKNNLLPTQVHYNSRTSYWWIYPYRDPESGKIFNFEWQARVEDRVRHPGCPFLTSYRVWSGFNDLATLMPELAKEWNYEKNANLTPNKVRKYSNKKVWWKCNKCGYEWESKIQSRANGSGCPYCSGRKAIKGVNDLATLRPDLLEEWDYEKNTVKPENFKLGSSSVKVWWKCKLGHEWKTNIHDRVIGHGCPYCAGNKVKSGFNDLKTLRPDLMKEWHPSKNGNLNPSELSIGTETYVWWKCELGHEWRSRVNNRVHGTGCPICAKEVGSSFPEQAIFYYLKKKYPDSVNRYLYKGVELDIYIPSLRVGVEYDGVAYHKDSNKDVTKNDFCIENNIHLVRIREKGCPSLRDFDKVLIRDDVLSDSSLNKVISQLFRLLRKEIEPNFIDINRDRAEIYQSYIFNKKKNSLKAKYPKIALEWNTQKNGSLTPESVSYGSLKTVWWVCEKGHEYQLRVGHKIKGVGCPYCSGKRVLKGFNDLETLNPQLALEWDYEKNGNLKPSEVTCGSEKVVWWRCNKGHSWDASIAVRVHSSGCPVCSNLRVQEGYNDLVTLRPDLAKDWDYEKNMGLTPSMVTPGSSKKVWWKCQKGHSYYTSLANRTGSKKANCPYCSGQALLTGFNDLATTHPELAKEWDFDKNYPLLPSQVQKGTEKKVWWKCSKGHSYLTVIYVRTNPSRPGGCPYCSGKKALKGYNDLATLKPDIAAEWNYERNGKLLPTEVSPGSNKKVWWKCKKCGYEWSSIINSRKNCGCPKCNSSSEEVTDHTGRKFESWADLCRYYNLPFYIVKGRVERGWSMEKALTTPPRRKRKEE